MYVLIPASGSEPYRHLKSLTFTPEADLTLSGIPVNEFRADIITVDMIDVGNQALLYDDLNRLWASYNIAKSERLDRHTIRIVAQSPLALMDRWKLPAQMFQGITVARFVELLFSIPSSGYLYNVDIEADDYFNGVTITGFCPEQTARERLHWLCLTIGALVKQCFAETLLLIPAPDVDPAAREAKGTLIPIADTYWKPSITTRELTRAVAVTGYENFTDVDPGEETGLVWEQGIDEQGVTWWFNPVDWAFENETTPEVPGKVVTINGVKLISGEAARSVLAWLSAAYFRQGEIRMDVINNAQYFPGQKVRVYVDEDTIYTGYIQSCDFSFGLQSAARIVLSSDLMQVPTGRLSFSYRYDDITIGRADVVLPEGEPYDMENPVLNWGSGVEYVPRNPRSTGTTPSGTTEIETQYYVDNPASIMWQSLPDKAFYKNGEAIDYTGLTVVAYDASGNPWTNRGLYPNGVIPLSDLILPAKVASIAGSTGYPIRTYGSPLDTGFWVQPIFAYPDGFVTYKDPDEFYEYHYEIDDGMLVLRASNSKSAMFYIIASQHNTTCRHWERHVKNDVELSNTHDNPEIMELSQAYTYNGLKVYYHSGNQFWYAKTFDEEYVTPKVNQEWGSGGALDRDSQVAWTIIYGNQTAAMWAQIVPILYRHNNITLEDYYYIYLNEGEDS